MDYTSQTQLRVYIKPFTTTGEYGEFEDVTKYVDRSSISSIKNQIDSTEFDIGVIKPSSISLKLANESGKFSDVGTINTMFATKRTDSIVKVTWDLNLIPVIMLEWIVN